MVHTMNKHEVIKRVIHKVIDKLMHKVINEVIDKVINKVTHNVTYKVMRKGCLKVIYYPLYSMNNFVTNKSKLPQDGAQVFPYMG